MPGAFLYMVWLQTGPFQEFRAGEPAPHSIGIITVVYQIRPLTLDA